MAAAPSGDPPLPAVRLKMAKRPRKVRQADPNTHRWLQCPCEGAHGPCGKWFQGPRKLDRHVAACHEGMLDDACLGCGKTFSHVTAIRYHCSHVCKPHHLPPRHIPKKGNEALEWQALLAEPAEVQEALLGAEEEVEQQHLMQTALLCGAELERQEEEQQQRPPPPRGAGELQASAAYHRRQ